MQFHALVSRVFQSDTTGVRAHALQLFSEKKESDEITHFKENIKHYDDQNVTKSRGTNWSKFFIFESLSKTRKFAKISKNVRNFLRDTFFKTRDERDWVCAKSSPNHLRFSDVLKNAILCGGIRFNFWQLSTSLGYSRSKNMHARLLCMISFISTCKSYASVSAKSGFFIKIFL